MRFDKFLSRFFMLVVGTYGLSNENNVIISTNPAIKGMANAMTLLKPVFVAEAKVQANILGSSIDTNDVATEIANEIKANKIVVYTYGLSPFSKEALSILDKSGYEYKEIELGLEWFLLGGKNSIKRVLLSEQVDNGATSLPKVFINGKCIGGCAELAQVAESGTLPTLINNRANAKSKKLFSF